jgi:hypothetical protein
MMKSKEYDDLCPADKATVDKLRSEVMKGEIGDHLSADYLAEIYLLRRDISEKDARIKEFLTACQMAYRKHHLDDQSIGWEEMSDVLQDAICNAMGDKEFNEWLVMKGR